MTEKKDDAFLGENTCGGVVEIKNISFVYSVGEPFERLALRDVTAKIASGEFVGLIGATGSGKSTLASLISGLEKPREGSVRACGILVSDKNAKIKDMCRFVGLVMQNPENQLFEETVRRDIAFGPKNLGLAPDEVESRVVWAANVVGLSTDLLNKSPFELSGGQRRRAAIAGVLAMRPRVLILDEPTAGLDPRARREILSKIKKMQDNFGITIILITHSMADAARFCDRLLVLSGGRLVMDGAPAKIFSYINKLRNFGLDAPDLARICAQLRLGGMRVWPEIYASEAVAQKIFGNF